MKSGSFGHPFAQRAISVFPDHSMIGCRGALPSDKDGLNGTQTNWLVLVHLPHQTLHTGTSQGGEILFDGRKRRPKVSGFRNVIKPDHRDGLRDLDSTFFESPDRP